MENEAATPPDESGWIESTDLREDEFWENILFHRIKIYTHKEKPSDVLLTMEFLGMEVILKCHAVKIGEKQDKYFYLKLSDNTWVKGLVDTRFNLDPILESRSGEQYLRLTVSLKTAGGIRRRILRKKIEMKK